MIHLPSCETISDLYVRSCQWKGREIFFADDGGVEYNAIDTAGIKVHAEEVEAALVSNRSVSQCAVVGRADRKFG